MGGPRGASGAPWGGRAGLAGRPGAHAGPLEVLRGGCSGCSTGTAATPKAAAAVMNGSRWVSAGVNCIADGAFRYRTWWCARPESDVEVV